MSHARFLVYSAPSVSAIGTAWFGWRLVSANNRPLGQATTVFDDVTACHQSISQVIDCITAQGAEARLIVNVTTGLWTWELAAPGEDVIAVAARGFQRQRECRQSAHIFRVAASAALISPEVLIVPARQRPGALRGLHGRQARVGLSLA